MTEQDLQSTCSGGGPVLGIPAELATEWRGTLPPLGAVVPAGWSWGTLGGPVCDYDRACDIEDRVGTPFGGFGSVPVGDGMALVFECELQTYWLPTDDGGVVLRKVECASIDEARALVERVPASVWRPWPRRLALRDGRIFFFDSAFEGAADPSAIQAADGVAIATPGPGTYAIATATDVDEQDFARLTRV
jgi:Immunity protein 21